MLFALAAAVGALAAGAEPDGYRTVVPDERPEASATAPVTVVPREALTAPGTTSREILGRQPGLHAVNLGSPTALSVARIRGSSTEQVRLFVDGIPMGSADGSPIDLSELPLWSAERLEIWRSHAPLARGGAIGGAMELISRRVRQPEAQLMAEAGAFSLWALRGHGAWTGSEGAAEHLQLALSFDLLTARSDFPWLDDKGTLYDSSDDEERRRENNDGRRMIGLLRAAYDDLGPCTLTLVDHVLAQERGLPGPYNLKARSARHERETNLLALRASCRRRGAWSLEARAGLRWQRSVGDDPDGELSRMASSQQRRALSPSASVVGGWLPTRWLRLALLAEGMAERFDSVDDLQDQREHFARAHGALAAEVGLAAEPLALEVVPRLRLSAFDDVQGAGPVEPSWQLAAAWHGLKREGLRVQAAGGSAIRQPNLYELWGDGVFVDANPDLRSERSLTGTALVAWAPAFLPAGQLAEVELSAFASRVEDLLRAERNTLTRSRYVNEDGADLLGFEAALRADLLGHLRLAWVHTSLRTTVRSDDPARDGKPLPDRPVARNYGHLEGYHTNGEGEGIRVFLDLDHVGTSAALAAGLARLPSRLELSAGAAGQVNVDGFAGPSGRLQMALIFRNITDQRSVDWANYPMPGWSWTLQLGYREAVF